MVVLDSQLGGLWVSFFLKERPALVLASICWVIKTAKRSGSSIFFLLTSFGRRWHVFFCGCLLFDKPEFVDGIVVMVEAQIGDDCKVSGKSTPKRLELGR